MPNNQIQSMIELLKESEIALLSSFENLTDEQFITKPSPAEWSIAEVIEHLTITDFGIIQQIKRKAEQLTSTVLDTANDDFIAKVVVPRKTKVKAPEFLIPSGKFKTKQEAIIAFQKTRNMVIQFSETTDLPLEKIVWKHFPIGLINGYGWINFIARHCQRHTLQIEEIKSSIL